MLLTSYEIASKGIVRTARKAGERYTTYDATVGSLFVRGKEIDAEYYYLPPRHIMWIVSNEEFIMPDDVTGLATLRTTWTHKGILALNVGVVDPGWEGPLSTAIVNFSKEEFKIAKGDPFLRLMFQGHSQVHVEKNRKEISRYRDAISEQSLRFSDTFLDFEQLSTEVRQKIFTFPFWGMALTTIALLLSIFAVVAPITYTIYNDYYAMPVKIESIQKQVDELSSKQAVNSEIDMLKQRLEFLEKNFLKNNGN